MRVLIDIGHPAHVHYFKNLIANLILHNNKVLVIAREREVIFKLLNEYDIPYINRGQGKNSFLGKLFYMAYADVLIYSKALKFKPDLFISFGSPYAGQVAKLIGRPHIALTDTEHTENVHKKFTYPFCSSIITPASYVNYLGPNHLRINTVIESLYLHPVLFQPSRDIYSLLGIRSDQEYVIVRFVSWHAFHDVGQGGLSIDDKRAIISLLAGRYKVFISSEGELDEEFKPYQISISPHKMHDALAFASLFIGESGTMASESAVLGTPVVYINSLPLMGYLALEQNHGLLKHFNNGIGVLEYLSGLISEPNLKKESIQLRDDMIRDFINPSNFLTWFVENYPKSHQIMRENPDYQYKFK